MRSIAVLLAFFVFSAVEAQPTHIVAYAHYNLNTTTGKLKTVDSESYTYSNHRPGWKGPVILENVLYDKDEFFYGIHDTTWYLAKKYTHTFDAFDNVVSMTGFNWIVATSSWDTTFQYEYTWTPGKDTASTFLRQQISTTMQPVSRSTYSHNTNNKRTQEVFEFWNSASSSWYYSWHNIIGYDSLDINRLYDSTAGYNTATMTWANPHASNQYTYIGNALASSTDYWDSSGTWKPNMLRESTYDTNSLITIAEIKRYKGTSWKLGARQLFTYNTDKTPQYIDFYESNPIPAPLAFKYRTYFTYTNGNLVFKYDVNAAGDTTYKNYYYYDKYNNVSKYDYQVKSGTTWVIKDRYLYYFDSLFPAAITVTNSFDGKLQVYPVPAAGMLNVHITFNKPEAFDAVICDMQGRVVKQWHEDAITEYSRSILINELTPGSYILNIKGTQSTSKVFVVQ